jgi:ATP synthase protein I
VGLGFELVVPVLVALYVGYRLDHWLGTRPWLMLVGAVLGMAVGFLGFFRKVLPPAGGSKGSR